ncbi:MAG: GNAT family N-acetyltransferase [Flavobacteriales bacterium]|nr:GNAT family N-acetyltransferase [Flavobacteriales bacterium]
MSIHWSLGDIESLGVHGLHEVLRLRTDVFVVEQRCAYAEVDGRDPEALHLLGRDDIGGLVAYARILPPDGNGHPHIGRVVVRADARGHGLARELMLRSIEAVRERFGQVPIAVSAQTYLEAFYAGLGFERQGQDYDWDGIAHVDMLLPA